MEDEIAAYVQGITLSLPASPNRLKQIQEKRESDDTCQLLRNYSMHGWPSKSSVDSKCVNYWQHRNEIAVEEGLLMRGSRIIIPASLQKEILESIHEGHQGTTKCRARARESVWWPGLSTQIEAYVSRCTRCIQEKQSP